MKYLGDVSFVIYIQIQRDRTYEILGLSQKAYNKKLERCSMKNCSRRDKLSLLQCPKNDLQKDQTKNIPYALEVWSLMYAQVCTHSDIAYTIEKLGRYLINPDIDHWTTAKKVIWYLQKTTWNLISCSLSDTHI